MNLLDLLNLTQLCQKSPDFGSDKDHIAFNLLIGEAHNPIARRLQASVARPIGLEIGRLPMFVTVEFDHKSLRTPNEVNTDWISQTVGCPGLIPRPAGCPLVLA